MNVASLPSLYFRHVSILDRADLYPISNIYRFIHHCVPSFIHSLSRSFVFGSEVC